MNLMLIVAILAISAVPMYAEAQKPSAVKLKADAQNVVKIISGDKLKTQTYCEIAELNDQIDQEEDRRKLRSCLGREINWRDNWVPNMSRWLAALRTSIQIPKAVKRPVRFSKSSTSCVVLTKGEARLTSSLRSYQWRSEGRLSIPAILDSVAQTACRVGSDKRAARTARSVLQQLKRDCWDHK